MNWMRWQALVACALIGCGRIGFDSAANTGDGGIDGDSEVGAPACTATQIEGFDLGVSGATDMAAALVGDGFAIGVVFGPGSTFWGMHLDANLMPAAALPFHTSPVVGFDGAYVDADLRWDGVTLVGALSNPQNTFFQTTFPTDMSSFIWNSPEYTGHATTPSVSDSGGVSISTWFEGPILRFMQLLPADGQGDGFVRTADTAMSTVTSASAAGGNVSVVALALDDGSCRVVSVGSDLSSLGRSLRSQCQSPHAARTGDAFTIVYERGGMVAMSVVQATPPPLQISTGGERDLAPGSRPRLVTFGAESWLAWIDAGSLQLGYIGEVFEHVTIAGLPSAPPDAFEVTDGHVFATYGSTLWAITCQ